MRVYVPVCEAYVTPTDAPPNDMVGINVPSSYQFNNRLVMPAAAVLAVKLMPLAAVLGVILPVLTVKSATLTERPAVRLATLTCVVALLCTIGRTSVPANGVVAAVRALIFLLVMLRNK